MNLLTRHLTGLVDFQGRENRQPFWLWILIVYAAQMILSMIAMIPIMMNMFNDIMPLARNDPHALDGHPEVMARIMGSMMQQMMLFVMISAVLFFILVAAAAVRRLHDGDRSGWWIAPYFASQLVTPFAMASVFPRYFAIMASVKPGSPPNLADPAFQQASQSMALFSLVNLVGFVFMVVLIVFLVLPGTVGPNRFGDDPLQPEPQTPFH